MDSGTSVGNGVQARVSYDLTGDGSWDRVETYAYFATDPVTGVEHYTQARGLASASGTLGNLVNGRVKVELWSAIGTGSSTVGGRQPVGAAAAVHGWLDHAAAARPPAADHDRRRPATATRTPSSRPRATTPSPARSTETTTDTGGGQDLGSLANGDWVAVQRRRLRLDRGDAVHRPGGVGRAPAA